MPGTYNPKSGLGRLLGGIFGGRPLGEEEDTREVGVGSPLRTAPADPLDPLRDVGEALRAAGEEDISEQKRTEADRLAGAQALQDRLDIRQETAESGFDRAEKMIEAGAGEIHHLVDDTRSAIKDIPEQVRGEFDRQQTIAQDRLKHAEGLVGVAKTEALSNVMQGQAAAMDAAVQTMHGQVNQAVSQIDAMVQTGQLSPAQAQSMKMQARMSGAMAIAPAIGATVHQFTQTQAQVATDFGNMLTSIETTGMQVSGAIGVAGGEAFAASSQAVGEMNVKLTEIDAQAMGQRSALLATNVANRAAAFNMNDQTMITMLDHLAETAILTTPAAINNYQAINNLVSTEIRMGHMDEALDIMRENIEVANKMARTNMILGIIEGVAGFLPFFGG